MLCGDVRGVARFFTLSSIYILEDLYAAQPRFFFY